jgi:hypothetical protein
MKSRFILFLLFFTCFSYSQKYNFDIYSCYFNNNTGINWKQIILTNSNNDKVKVILNQKDDYYIGAIQEYTKDSLIYHFVEVRIDSSKSFNIQFKYTSSMKGKLREYRKCFDENNFYEISRKQTAESNNEIIIYRYKNAKKNKLISEVKLITKDTDFPFFNHFAYGYFNSQFMDCQSLDIDKNILIRKATFSGNINYSLTLIDYKNLPIEIIIQNPNYKK